MNKSEYKIGIDLLKENNNNTTYEVAYFILGGQGKLKKGTDDILTSTDFSGADLTGAILIGTTLNTADFTNATVNDANFTGATLTTGIPEVIDVTSSNLTPDSAPGGGVGLLILPSNISIVSGAFFIFSPVIQIKQLILAQKNKTLSILTEDGKTFQIIA